MENPPRPQCCPEIEKEGGGWWRPSGLEGQYVAGWVMIRNCSIPARTYWLCNPTFCPFCGTKLPLELAGVEPS